MLEAAQVRGVGPGRHAKTLAFRGPDERAFLVVVRGDARIDNAKVKAAFNGPDQDARSGTSAQR